MWKSITLAFFGTVALSGAASAACSAYPYTLTNGTTADASQVMANFNCVLGSPVFSGPVGIGMVPVNILDITQNQNSGSLVSILNNTTGTAAYSAYLLKDDVSENAQILLRGSGWTTTGINQPQQAELFTTAGNGLVIDTGAAAKIIFGINNVEAGRFASDNSFLVGTTTSGGWNSNAKAEIRKSASSGAALSLYDTTSSSDGLWVRLDNTSASDFAVFWNAGTVVGSIQPSGSSSTVYLTTSDERLKSDRGVLSAVPELMRLRVHRFLWKSDKKPDIGLFAQEAYKVLPGIVHEGGSDPNKKPWQVNYTGLIPRLLVGWQDHEKRIEIIENENAQLKAANDNQAAELKELKVEVSALERKAGVRTAQR